MHIRLLAVGERQPQWVDSAFAEYARRLPRQWQFRLQPISPGKRGKGVASSAAIASECRDLLANVTAQDWVVLLDEDGRQESSVEIASRLAEWQQSGRNIVFVIGGPDGVSDEMRKRADHCWSLSALTLPHGLARVVFAEQLYRCWSIAEGHPYHRD